MCDSPMLAVRMDVKNKETGKEVIRFLSRTQVDYSYESAKAKYGKRLLLIPCGSCPSCLKRYSFDWSVRLMAESLYHQDNSFITLTYRPEHYFDDPEIIKNDLQKFFKRLRFHGFEFRYFCCVERGDLGNRLHAHAILFGVKFDDLKVISYNSLGQALYSSATLDNIWTHGLTSVGEVTAESCGYVARYSLKKRIIGKDSGEFLLMSRRPAIGYQFFLDHKHEIYLSDKVYNKKFVSTKPPRFFDKLAEKDDDIGLFFQYQIAKNDREKKSKGHEYHNLICFGAHSIEEAQVIALSRGMSNLSSLRRSL